jgi:hypothetical protein
MFVADVTWSYSALNNFETCPRRFEAVQEKKTHVEVEGIGILKGKQVHKYMERYVIANEPVPDNLHVLRLVADRVLGGAQDVLVETRLGVTARLTPCQFFDSQVSLRSVVDLTAVWSDAIVVVDWKTSKIKRESELQLQLSALAALAHYPGYDTAHCVFAYDKHPHTRIRVDRADLPAIVREVNPRLERLKRARAEDVWPERPGWACRFCPVTSCVHNERRH